MDFIQGVLINIIYKVSDIFASLQCLLTRGIKMINAAKDKENQSPVPVRLHGVDAKDHIKKYAMSPNSKLADDMVNDDLLEKIRTHGSNKQENNDTIRHAAGRLHSRLTSSDRKIRERAMDRLLQKNTAAMETFVTALENCRDNVANCSILSILHECISPRSYKKKAKVCKTKNNNLVRSEKNNTGRIIVIQLINLGGTQILIKLLLTSQHVDTIISDVMVQEILWLLGQIVQKDAKFAAKVKQLNATKVFHNLLKQHYNQNITLFSLLLIMKSLAQNSYCLQTLVRSGVMNTLEKTFVYLGYTPHMKLKTLVECLKHFTASRLCCTKFVKIGMVHLIMRIFERWERIDNPIKLKIFNYALSTLQHVCVIKAGRKAIKANSGLQLLYRFCTNCPEDKTYDCLLSRVFGIINQCLEKKELPVPDMSPARFPLPGSSTRASSVESGSDVDSQAYSVASLTKTYSDVDSCDDDDDDCTSSRKSKDKKIGDELDESKFFAGVINFQRPDEDLMNYYTFFRELGSLQTQLNNVASQIDESIKTCITEEEKTILRLKKSKLLKPNTKYLVKNFPTGNGFSVNRIDLRIMNSIPAITPEQTVYCLISSKVKSVTQFVKVAYPDLIGGNALGIPEPLNAKDRQICRSKLLTCVERGLHPSPTQETVFDLDHLTTQSRNRNYTAEDKILCNIDEIRTGKREYETKQHLHFESRFESGNLRKVIQVGPREYDLILTPDVNSASRHQWFYFEVSNTEADVAYTFNIVNCEKANSQFNFGMKPILFSVIEAQLGRAGWVRTGTDICYYRNCYQKGCKKNYLTTSFTVTFKHNYDVCYLAYHFPYTYSRLLTNIWKQGKTISATSIYFRVENLCDSLNGNENPLLTITAPDSSINPIQKRKTIFLTSRVHPGESNASWVMHGTLEGLLSNTPYAASLRNDYIFKIVPMLNIEGVINGCNRYGLTNEDLNRRWSNPNQVLHPVIYHTKGLMEYCTRILLTPPHVFVDYHGHSRRKNVFLFGCSKSGSWSAADRTKPDEPMQYLLLPHLMQKTSPAFALPLCSFKVERHKESTARVAVWRQLGVSRSYTMESSFCGCDQGTLAGFHLDTKHLKDIGQDFCQALSLMKEANEDWHIDKSAEERYCCPSKCILKKPGKMQKCIQDKHAKHHILDIR